MYRYFKRLALKKIALTIFSKLSIPITQLGAYKNIYVSTFPVSFDYSMVSICKRNNLDFKPYKQLVNLAQVCYRFSWSTLIQQAT